MAQVDKQAIAARLGAPRRIMSSTLNCNARVRTRCWRCWQGANVRTF